MRNSESYKHTVNVKPFNILDISVVCDVAIVPSVKEKVDVESEEYLHELIQVDNKNNTLVIRMKKKNLSKSISGRILIYIKDLKEIINSSAGNISSNGIIITDRFSIQNDSVGNLALQINAQEISLTNNAIGETVLKGNCHILKIKSKGIGTLNTRKLNCQILTLNNKAIGNTIVMAQKEFYIENIGIGTLDLYGGGDIKKMENATIGKVINH